MRATVNQKKYIKHINRLLKIPDAISQDIVNSIATYREADLYIKEYLPKAKIRNLNVTEIFELYERLENETRSLRG